MATTQSAPRARPTDSISYSDLYRRWEHGNWSAMDLDFTQDAIDWQEKFTPFEREAALFNYALFFWGEDAVADNLSPYIDAAPLEEQKYFLTTQQVDEARHAVFFTRFMHEALGIGKGDVASGLQEIRPLLSWGFNQVFDRLDRMADELRADRSIPNLCRAVTLYHLVIEATMAQPGQHMITSYLEERDVMPGFRAGMEKVSADELRHIGFGVKLLADLTPGNEEARVAVAEMLRECVPWLGNVFRPPGWDERYLTTFGWSFDKIGEESVLSLETKLRSAGLAFETLPGPEIVPLDLPPVERSRLGMKLAKAGIMGPGGQEPDRDPETMATLFDVIRRGLGPDHGLRGPATIEWDFTDADPWHVRIEGPTATAVSGRAPHADLRLKVAYRDWVDVIGGRADARRLLLTRRMRPSGSLRLLARMPRIFPR
ncbi:ribonucleotide reductase [Patulibacter medicamentivorans]|uniref:Ribonucleotide reductase n=1 Tax=Patulibacter medicamentivorans TaxID=1097667 RepID=H0E281_9ACTN|nr:ribonucleotide-diphosphate reductase subunit beta [Patulibacter medicamentivorans]EHN12218.1 ribonucleotide reductase [Patulibacter medicamentivorans]